MDSKSAYDFMMKEPHGFGEWLSIGSPKTMQRISECLNRYPREIAVEAITKACVKTDQQTHQ